MNTVLRAAAIYLFLVFIFRVSGRRALAQITTFDLVLILIISEAAQQGMIGDDYSLTTAFLAILTLVGIDVGLSLWKQRSPKLDLWLDGLPLVLVEDGTPYADRLHKARVDESDILTAARELQGLERMEQIKYAVLERSGGISIIPKR
ncbi:MAG TPA: YetF domain-containing protein [Blastocatellia bacterium]|nr:YetF domain-containing protein [Blastocatellia bacterium]